MTARKAVFLSAVIAILNFEIEALLEDNHITESHNICYKQFWKFKIRKLYWTTVKVALLLVMMYAYHSLALNILLFWEVIKVWPYLLYRPVLQCISFVSRLQFFQISYWLFSSFTYLLCLSAQLLKHSWTNLIINYVTFHYDRTIIA